MTHAFQGHGQAVAWPAWALPRMGCSARHPRPHLLWPLSRLRATPHSTFHPRGQLPSSAVTPTAQTWPWPPQTATWRPGDAFFHGQQE